MSARNRGPPLPTRGGPHGGMPQPPIHEPPFLRGVGRVPHPASREEMMEPRYTLDHQRQQFAIIEERLAVQHDDIQVFLVDNQSLAATHVALRQELEAAQYELQRADKFAQTFHAEKDLEMRQLHEKSIKMENELGGVNAMRAELMQVHMDIKELTAAKQDVAGQVQMMTQDLTRVKSDLQQVPAIKAEIEELKHELERARTAVEHEKKGFAESFEHGKVMENKLVSMAKELEKLRAELSNAETRARSATAVANSGMGYNYSNSGSGYPGNSFSVGYNATPSNSLHPAPGGAQGYPQYGAGPGAWGSYNTQHAQGPK